MKIPRPAFAILILIPAYLTVAGLPEYSGKQPEQKRQQQLRQVLAQNCSVCHGPALKGDVGPALTPKSLAGKNDDMLVATILEGRDGTLMPAWGWMLQEKDARWLVQFLRDGKQP